MNKNQSLPWDHPRFRSWIAVARACQLMQQSLGRALAHLDIKPPHLDILVNLFRFEGHFAAGVGRASCWSSRSNMSMLLPQMEKRGLIERRGDKHDKRVLRLYLTAEGRRVTEEAMAIQTDLIDRMLSDAPLDECDIMTAHMERIVSLLLQEEREPLKAVGDQ